MQPAGSSPARPPLVQGAGITLIVAGGLSALFSLFALVAAGSVGLGGFALPYVLISVALAAFSIYAGLQVLALKPQGRILGLVAAGIGALFSLMALVQGNVFSIIFLAAYGFVIYALVTSQSAFNRT